MIGSDTGGTFTDLVADDGSMVKVPSTPDDPGEGLRRGIEGLRSGRGRSATAEASGLAGAAGAGVDELVHGTTVATNALLERKGARIALVTNRGFADVVEIARQDRPSLYDQRIDRPSPLVPREWRYEVTGRLDATGAEIEAVDLDSLPPIDPEVEAVAVCLLHADLNPAHERAVAAHLRDLGLDVTASHEISPEFREYERTVTTAVNAYLRPRCRSYLAGLAPVADRVRVMTSAAGTVPVDEAGEWPARLLLSGPVGGALAGAATAVACGHPDAVTFDMGGTSTDVCLVLDGRPEPASARDVAGLPVRLPSLDVHTIGAGGGSIARIDPGGALAVGPESAGARPGPACYGHGGTRPTVTDADLVLGRIPADLAFPGLGTPDGPAARVALAQAGVDAAGVVAVVDAAMVQALRRVTVERGVDPRNLALVAFGGAGPLHACSLATSLGIEVVIVPPRAGVFSAVGILTAPRQVDLVRSWPNPSDHSGVTGALERLGDEAAERLAGWDVGPTDGEDAPLGSRSAGWDEGSDVGSSSAWSSAHGAAGPIEVVTSLDCRYRGQSWELRVPGVAAFGLEHERRNGYRRPGWPVEVVALRASARQASPVRLEDLPPVERHPVRGPAVVAEADCTIWVPEDWSGESGPGGALLLHPVR